MEIKEAFTAISDTKNYWALCIIECDQNEEIILP